MARGRRWSDLSPRTRRLIVVAGSVEAMLKLAALADIARRPARQIKGPKPAWIVAVTLANSAGAVPLAYFAFGRRPAPATD